MDAVGAFRHARRHLVQEHHLTLPVLDPHGMQTKRLQRRRQRGKFVIMGGEQRPRTVDVVQVLDAGPSDGEAVIGGGAAADFIQNHQAARPSTVENGRRFHHFHHEGGAPPRQIVGRPHPREKTVHHAHARAFRWHEETSMGHHRDQRILSQERAFTRHVGAGE